MRERLMAVPDSSSLSTEAAGHDGSSSKLAIAALLALASVIAATAFAALIQGNPAAPSANGVQTLPTVRSVDPALKGSFAVLDRAPSSAAIESTAQVPMLHGANPVGANTDLARRAVAGNGDVVYLVPANRGICAVSSASVGCVPTRFAKQGYGVALGQTPGGIRVTGLAPDGVSSVTLMLADGNTRRAVVAGNVYSLRAKDVGTTAIAFRREGRKVTVPFRTDPVKAFAATDRSGLPVRVR